MKKPNDTLFLILKSKWFFMLDSGEKKEEYRRITPFWEKRIWERRHEYSKVCFQLGYAKNALRMKFDIKYYYAYHARTGQYGIDNLDIPAQENPAQEKIDRKKWGFEETEDTFIIGLGNRLDGSQNKFRNEKIKFEAS